MSVRPSIRCAAPATCSGAMYAGVPEMTPSSEPPAPASSRPSPKSTRTGPRSGVRMMFAGLTSRWTMSRAWAWARASATAAAIRAASGQAGRLIPQPPAEVGAVEEIRDDVDLPPVQADVMDRHDAGVAQLREPAGLLEESLRLGLRHLGAAAEDLDGHGPVELRVVAEVHRAEAAGPQGVPHLVAAEGGRRGRGVPLRRRLGRRTRRQVRGQIRLAPRLRFADGRAWKRGIRLHGDIARGLVWVGLTRWVQCRFLLASQGGSLRRSRELRAERLGGT